MSEDQSTVLFNGRWLRMRMRDQWEYVERTNPLGAAVIIAVTPDGEVLFVEQYRVPIRRRTLEFPAGLVGDRAELADEGIAESARRELLEETGWEAGWLRPIMGGPSSAGMSTEVMHFWRAGGLIHRHAGGGDGSEDIRVHRVAVAEASAFVHARMQEGFAVDPKVYAGIHFLSHDADGSRLDLGWWR
ncbi:MAG: NUDIX hydrolase [Xanthomonadales bacterium]|jgi:ADP-ribose pyrophosphatase|nr:NUDIX hydrolase [Xanthomonadales bacterium]